MAIQTMRNFQIALSICLSTACYGQDPCQPSFGFGCFNWRNQSMEVAELVWQTDGDCTNSDHMDQTATVYAGQETPMTVFSGNWTGCAVWVDLNMNELFEEEENVFHAYVGGDPGYSYSFAFVVPATTPSGPYRMRVIAPWGSDGFDPVNKNGHGPCGEYQYGNFDEFTLVVVNTTGMVDTAHEGTPLLFPNPTTGALSIPVNSGPARILVFSADGRETMAVSESNGAGNVMLDLSDRPAGAYFVRIEDAQGVHSSKVLKM